MKQTTKPAPRLSPVQARVLPFAVFVALTVFQGWFGEGSRYWIYVLKTGVGAALIWQIWPMVPEMRWRFSWTAVAAGSLVALLWVGLDPFYPKWGKSPTTWDPFAAFSGHHALACFFVICRILGSAIVVPPIEEIFYRSFLYRYLVHPAFETVSFRVVRWGPFFLTAGIFGLAHYEWLAGFLCGAIYQGLVCRRGRLGDAICAHAVTNLLLGLWVVWRGAWHFW